MNKGSYKGKSQLSRSELAGKSPIISSKGRKASIKPRKRPAPKKVRTLAGKRTLEIHGYFDGINRRAEVRFGSARAWIRTEQLASDPKAVHAKLRACGISMTSTKSQRRLVGLVDEIAEWTYLDIASERGLHNETHFILSDDFAAMPPFTLAPRVLLEADSRKWAAKGTPVARERAAALLEGQNVPIFCTALAFAAPLLTLLPEFGHFVFEIVGDDEPAIEMALRWAGSIYGGDPGRQHGFVEPWPTSVEALGLLLREHSAYLLPMIGVSPGIVQDAASNRQFAQMVSRLCQHERSGDHPHAAGRYTGAPVCLIGGKVPLRSLLSTAPRQSSAGILDRVLTIPVPLFGGINTFDTLPKAARDLGTAIIHINGVSAANYGFLIRTYLSRLKRWNSPWRRLPRQVDVCVQRFVKAVGVNKNDGEALQIARVFGLIYAAGCLAKTWGLVPRKWRTGRAIANCYRAHLEFGGKAIDTTPAFERILEYVRRHKHEFVDLRSGTVKMDDAAFAKAWGFMKIGAGGNIELLISPARMRAEYHDWEPMMQELRDQGRARVEGGQQPKLSTKIDIRGNGKLDRVYCILLGSATSLISEASARWEGDLDPPAH